MRRRKTLPAPHCRTHLSHVFGTVMRCMFLQSRFLPLRQRHLPYASSYGRADLANLIVLIHGFHLQAVVLAESLRARADGGTHSGANRATQLPHDWRNRPDHPSRDPGVVVQMREELLALVVRMPKKLLPVHETLLDSAHEP